MKKIHISHSIIIVALTLSFILGGIYLVRAALNSKMHNFEGKCQICHRGTPAPNAERKDIVLVDESERLCISCHTVDKKMSHPIRVVPSMPVPGEMPLDKQNRLTCITCHDVHKEDKASFRKDQLAGLLRGHVQGRAFCFICHSRDISKSSRRHQTSVSYAHGEGRLIEKKDGSLLDSFSRECLSCHDGTISKMPSVSVREGIWKHGVSLSHPIGVRYPRDGDFRAYLPKKIRLFDGKVGCLSCHDPYAKERNLLVMSNRRSRLCLSCHNK
ncbi:MAG: hypothetical protein GXO98_03305 [Nitrospirae bacterium]|nr:hypothetical protein [Nitrospirota bacterium]